jgi:quercetin dioxygenase-like cupin family protein
VSIAVTKWRQTDGEPQLGALRRRLEAEGMATAWYSEVPGVVFPEHEHAFAEARWVMAGFLQIEAAGETIVLGPGDRIDIPARTPHRAQVLGLTPVIYVTGAPPDAFPRPTSSAVSAA